MVANLRGLTAEQIQSRVDNETDLTNLKATESYSRLQENKPITLQKLNEHSGVLNIPDEPSTGDQVLSSFGRGLNKTIRNIVQVRKLENKAREFASNFNNDPAAAEVFQQAGGDHQKALELLQQRGKYMKNYLSQPGLKHDPEVQDSIRDQLEEEYMKARGIKDPSKIDEKGHKEIDDQLETPEVQESIDHRLSEAIDHASALEQDPRLYADITGKPKRDFVREAGQKIIQKGQGERDNIRNQVGILEASIKGFKALSGGLGGNVKYSGQSISIPKVVKGATLKPLTTHPTQESFEALQTQAVTALAIAKKVRGFSRIVGNIKKSLPDTKDSPGGRLGKTLTLSAFVDAVKEHNAEESKFITEYEDKTGELPTPTELSAHMEPIAKDIDKRFGEKQVQSAEYVKFLEKVHQDSTYLGKDSNLIGKFLTSVSGAVPEGKEAMDISPENLNKLYDEYHDIENGHVQVKKGEFVPSKADPGKIWYADEKDGLKLLDPEEERNKKRAKDAI